MGGGGGGIDIPFWQPLTFSFLVGWLFFSSLLNLTRRFRSLTRPWVTKRVQSDTHFILKIQSKHHGLLDGFFSVLSCVVSVPFYTGFLPFLFWVSCYRGRKASTKPSLLHLQQSQKPSSSSSTIPLLKSSNSIDSNLEEIEICFFHVLWITRKSGHSKLARQMTILMALCDYVGNAIKDLVSAPRPSCPPVRRVASTDGEKENAMEYGLPSSHALNTVCLSGYFLYYVLTCRAERDSITVLVGFALVFTIVMLIAIARIYLGMHSLIDVMAGISFGLVILAFWIMVHGYIDDFIVNGQNVTFYWAGLSLLLCFAYPTPEVPTPSFDYHTAFTGVAFGIISGVQQTYLHFHHEGVPHLFSPQLPVTVFLGRMLVGIPTILIVKFCSKAIAKWLLLMICNTLCIPIISSCYIPALKDMDCKRKSKADSNKQSSYFQKVVSLFPPKEYDVDTGIRFLQYAGLAWSVVDLVPSLFSYLSL